MTKHSLRSLDADFTTHLFHYVESFEINKGIIYTYPINSF